MNIANSSIDYSLYGERDYQLSNAIYIYQRAHHDNIFVRHQIKQDGSLALGVPVDAATLSKLFACDNNASTELIPEKLLVDNSQFSIWWSARQRRRMFFRVSNRPSILLVNYPSLIWGVNKANRSLYVATIANKRPTPKTPIYHAPLMNIDGYGLVCQGTAKIPDLHQINSNTIQKIEACIFDSNFTHVNHDKTLKSNKRVSTTGQLKYWKQKAKAGSSSKLSELNKSGTVADFIERVG